MTAPFVPLLQLHGRLPPRDLEPDADEHAAADSAGFDPQTRFERMVAEEAFRIRVREAAREAVEQGRRAVLEPFDAGTLAEVLARPPAPSSRVQDLVPWQASTLITAARKTGKTTTVLNLARSLLTGEDFLGRHGVRPVVGSVALLNFEVSAATVAHWAADVGIDPDRLYLVNLRGRRNPLKHPDDRSRLAELLKARGTETVICDPFGRAFTGQSQNDAGEVGSFLCKLDEFTRSEVGALDLILTAHAGWNGERTRGSTALEDWPDVVITLTRDDTEDGTGERYLRALGRDVDLDEQRLDFDPGTRLLTLSGSGSRKTDRADRRADQLRQEVLAIVTTHGGLNGAGVERELRGGGVVFQKGQERKALSTLVEQGLLTVEKGKGNSKIFQPPQPPQTSPSLPDGDSGEPPQPPYIWGGSHQGGSSTSVSPTCATCGGTMVVVEDGQTTHPNCEAA